MVQIIKKKYFITNNSQYRQVVYIKPFVLLLFALCSCIYPNLMVLLTNVKQVQFFVSKYTNNIIEIFHEGNFITFKLYKMIIYHGVNFNNISDNFDFSRSRNRLPHQSLSHFNSWTCLYCF